MQFTLTGSLLQSLSLSLSLSHVDKFDLCANLCSEVINYDHALYNGWPYLPVRTDSHDGTEKYSSHYRERVAKI